MGRQQTRNAWIIAGAVLGIFVLLAVLVPRLAGAAAARFWLLTGGLLFFGVVAAALTLLVLRSRARRQPDLHAAQGGDEVEEAFQTAGARLAASGSAAEARIDRLPIVLVLGPPGATKSSIVTHSGLDPDLLAGEVFRAEAVVPTEVVNVWYAQGTVVTEAGGRLLDDPVRWQQLIRQLRPSRIAAALGRRRQAPRTALLCIGCDELLKPGASQSLAATARLLRTRLGEMSSQLGIRLPVYVLFTRADRLPYFTEYLRNFTGAEAQQVLGATLPLAPDAGGAWAERESERVNSAFARIVRGLAVHRLDVLARESQEDVRAATYEFPRELRKINELAVQFLLDVFRPNQLGVNPFLRGFYFTGVRPVVVSDVAADPAPRPAASAVDAGATQVFNPRMLQNAAPAAATGGMGRRIPQWVFVQRLFRDVLLRDDVALGMTGGGTRVDLLRHGLIAAAAAACVVLTLGFTVSYAGNRSLLRNSIAAMTNVRDLGSVPGTMGEEDLYRLDTLRERTARIGSYERDGRPMRLAWGLYTGDDVHPHLRRFYFERFDATLWTDARERLIQHLRALPERPDENSDFGRAQDALAAHLLTTSEHRRSSGELLAPILLQHWRGPAEGDTLRALAARQFAFFGDELPFGNPYDARLDAPLVERTQRFLRAFGMEAYYRALVYEASNSIPPVRYDGPSNIVRNNVVVPGAFTLAGARNVQVNLDSVDNLFVRYQWIYGSQPPTNKPKREELADMYVREYVRRWQDYLAQGSVERFGSIGDAAARLGVLGAPSSPLFGMLAIASRETAMDSTTVVGSAFQPLHVTVTPGADPRGVTAGVLGYANALTALASTLNLLTNATGSARDAAQLQASAAAAEVKREASTIAAAFVMTGDAALTASSIQRLLRQPADLADGLVSGLPAAQLNAAGAAFCASYDPLARQFPFNARASADAQVDEVNAMFRKEDGVLWSFYQDALQSLITPQGAPRPGARVRAEFRPFFSRAAEFSNAVYRGGGGPSLVFDFQPDIPAGASEVVLQLDGDAASFTPTSRASRSLEWEAERASDARLIVVFDGERVEVAGGRGPWAVFRLFGAASSWTGSGPYRVEWRVPGRSAVVAAQMSFEGGVAPVLRPGYLAALSRCVSQIAN